MNYFSFTGIIAVAGAALFSVLPLSGAEKLAPPRREHKGPNVRNMRRTAMVWRVFSQLDDAERKKMQELQRSNPEEFASAMRTLVDKYEKLERARVEKLSALMPKHWTTWLLSSLKLLAITYSTPRKTSCRRSRGWMCREARTPTTWTAR